MAAVQVRVFFFFFFFFLGLRLGFCESLEGRYVNVILLLLIT